MPSLLNHKNVRALALEMSKESRCGRFTRVSADFVNRLERKIHETIEREVMSHPSMGVTLK